MFNDELSACMSWGLRVVLVVGLGILDQSGIYGGQSWRCDTVLVAPNPIADSPIETC